MNRSLPLPPRNPLRSLAAAAALALWSTASSSANAAPSPIQPGRRAASVDSAVSTESSQVLPKWTPSVGLSVGGDAGLTRRPEQAELMSRGRADLLLAFGLFGWTELSVDLPLILRQTLALPEGGTLAATGFGDLRVGLKGTALKIPSRGIGLGLSFDVTVPTGMPSAHLGLGGLSYAPQFLFEHRGARGIRSLINIGYLARPDAKGVGHVNGDGITLRGAARIPLSATRPLSFVVEIDSRIGLVRGGDHGFLARLGLRRQVRNGLVLGAYVSGAPALELGPGQVGGLLTLAWAPPSKMGTERAFDGSKRPSATALALRHDVIARRHATTKAPPVKPGDPDGDGILAAADLCPHIAEDLDGFEDDDGCPELDNDRDAIADIHDLCPLSPEIINGGLDLDGCPDRRLADGSYQSLSELDPNSLAPKIAFKADSNELTDESRASLDAWVELARLNPWIERLDLAVYVHPSKDSTADQLRAQARADAITMHCQRAGLEPWRISVRELGAIPAAAPEQVRVAVVGNIQGLRPLAPARDVLDRWIAQAAAATSAAPSTPAPDSTTVEYSAQGPEAKPEPAQGTSR